MEKNMYIKLKQDLAIAVKEKDYEKIAELRKILDISDEQAKYFEEGLTGYPTVDRPWDVYTKGDFDPEKDIPNMSIYQLALESNKENMKNVALDLRTSKNDFSKGLKITYENLFSRVDDSAKSSTVIGIKPDDIIPLVVPNLPEARIAIYSNSKIGAVSFPISPLMSVNQLEKIIKENRIKNLVIFDMFYEKYAPALKCDSLENIIMLDGTESLPKSIQELLRLKEFLKGTKRELYKGDKRIIPWYEYDKYKKDHKGEIVPYYVDNHTAAIIGTSGTTGLSKGAMFSDRNINAAALSYKNGGLFKGNFLDALIPSIGYGISILHYQTVDGKYVYLSPELLTTKFPDALLKLQPDNYPGGPVHYINIRNSGIKDKMVKWENLISGGATLPKDLEKELNGVDEGYEEYGDYDKLKELDALPINDSILVRQGYGLTENVAVGTYNKRGTYKFGSIGIPMLYATIGIFKEGTDEELSYNEKGEICITGPMVMQGYLNNKDETEKTLKLHSDGKVWIHTKDKGYMDETGHLFHVDRFKNIFMRTGFNVHPSSISNFIDTIPGVSESAVIGFEHPEEQCVPIAFVVLDNNRDKEMTEEKMREKIMQECVANLEQTSVPYEIVFTNTLPINLGGKVDQIRIAKESGIDLMKDLKVKKKVLKFEQ